MADISSRKVEPLLERSCSKPAQVLRQQLAQTPALHPPEDVLRGSPIAGVVLTMYDRRNNLSELVAADVRSVFHHRVYDTLIPRNVRISEAPSHGKPVLLYDASSAGAVAMSIACLRASRNWACTGARSAAADFAIAVSRESEYA